LPGDTLAKKQAEEEKRARQKAETEAEKEKRARRKAEAENARLKALLEKLQKVK